MLYWLILAIALFWALGAYNRLVLLRSAATQAFGLLAAELQKQLQILESARPAELPATEDAQPDLVGLRAAWDGLQGAIQQVHAGLNAAGKAPLQIPTMQALRAAQLVLVTSLERLVQAHAAAGDGDFAAVRVQWEERTLMSAAARVGFEVAVDRYNEAIHQFPASVLAWVFGFRTAWALPGEG